MWCVEAYCVGTRQWLVGAARIDTDRWDSARAALLDVKVLCEYTQTPRPEARTSLVALIYRGASLKFDTPPPRCELR